MSAQSERQDAVEHHDTDAHDAHDSSGSHHGSFKDYLIGFVLAAVHNHWPCPAFSHFAFVISTLRAGRSAALS